MVTAKRLGEDKKVTSEKVHLESAGAGRRNKKRRTMGEWLWEEERKVR